MESIAALTTSLRDLGALGVLQEPGAAPRASLYAVFDDSWDRERLLDRVRAAVNDLAALDGTPPGRVRISALVADGWAEVWPEEFVPVAIGRRLLITPSWMTPPASDRLVIVLEAGQGFGTGHHASTAGCLAKLEAIVEREGPERALDLGTGSGLLAIAAARLGVKHVLAIDNDADAVAAAAANASRNAVSDRVRCMVGDAGAIATDPAPLVTANLLTGLHERLAGRYRTLVTPTGTLVLGGIADTEAPGLIATLAGAGLALRDELTFDGWSTLVLSRAGSD